MSLLRLYRMLHHAVLGSSGPLVLDKGLESNFYRLFTYELKMFAKTYSLAVYQHRNSTPHREIFAQSAQFRPSSLAFGTQLTCKDYE